MTPAAADWIYDAVIPQRIKESVGAIQWTGAREKRRDEGPGRAALRRCQCQYGPCGRCASDRADLCLWVGKPAVVSPAGNILNTRGLALVEFRTSGRPCRWKCPGVPAIPYTVGPAGQLELFDVTPWAKNTIAPRSGLARSGAGRS